MAETDQKVWKMEHHGQVSLYETVIFTAERGANPYDGQARVFLRRVVFGSLRVIIE